MLKGPRFPSFVDPPRPSYHPRPVPQRSLPAGQQYLSHEGKAARLRRLRQACRTVLKSTDPRMQELIQRIEDAIPSEFFRLQMIHSAQLVSAETGLPFDAALEFLIEDFNKRFKEELNKQADTETPVADAKDVASEVQS